MFEGTLPAAERPATASAIALAREAVAAAENQDFATYMAKMEDAVALRPDFPRLLVNLAAAQVANEKSDEAIGTLERLAALGLNSPVEKSEDFTELRERRDFQAVVRKLAGNLQARGPGHIAFTLREVTGLIEGIAWREKTGDFFFGDVNGRAVWRRGPDGTLHRLTGESDELFGVFGLAVDEARGALWAATSAVPAMRGFSPEMDGTAALVEIDLDSGTVRRVVPVVRRPGDRGSHVLGDLVVAADGSVFVTDSGAPLIWRLDSSGALEPLIESPEFMSLQGIVALPGATSCSWRTTPTGSSRSISPLEWYAGWNRRRTRRSLAWTGSPSPPTATCSRSRMASGRPVFFASTWAEVVPR